MKYRSLLIGCLTLLLLGLIGAVIGADPARASAVFTVDSTIDEPDASSGDGLCASTPSGVCTLRAAIMEANALNGADTINLPAGIYTLTVAGANENAAVAGDLDIADDLTLIGSDAATTIIDGNGKILGDRVFEVVGTVAVHLSQVTVQHGNAINGGGLFNSSGTLTLTTVALVGNHVDLLGMGLGGGVSNGGAALLVNTHVLSNTGYQAGGIQNFGTLMLVSSTVSGNIASATSGGVENSGLLAIHDSTISSNTGGGIYNSGVLTITTSAIVTNTTPLNGAGISNSGDLLVVNSTVAHNSANFDGGGIYTFAPGTVSLRNATLVNNTADNDGNGSGKGGGILGSSSSVTLANTLLAGNIDLSGQAPDCSGALTSSGYNLIQNTTGCLVGGDVTGNIVGVDPFLDILRNNGGPTLTHALLPGSPAIDSGNPAGCTDSLGDPLTTDQRSYTRPVDGDSNGSPICDIGAYELGGIAPTPTPTQEATNTSTNTPTATETPTPTATSMPTLTSTPTPTPTSTPSATPSSTPVGPGRSKLYLPLVVRSP